MKDDSYTKNEALCSGGGYIDLRKANPELPEWAEQEKLERLAKAVRALIFATVEAAQSGHPGGSSSKVEQLLSLILGGDLAFDPLQPKHPGRDRIVWSAGHCTPLLYSVQAMLYEALRRNGKDFDPKEIGAVTYGDLDRFRRADGPQGHAESHYPLSDMSTGSSGHGLSAALGLAVSHRGSGLPTTIWTVMGDAETEEGISFEARNMALSAGADNLIVLEDVNRFGIDGPVREVISDSYLNHWLGLGWNVIEVDGHDFVQCLAAYRMAADRHFGNGRPTAILAHTLKGKMYGTMEDTAKSHGSPIGHEEYVSIVRSLGFDIEGRQGGAGEDIAKIISQISEADLDYVVRRLEISSTKVFDEETCLKSIKSAIGDRPLVDPRQVNRPTEMPPELTFEPGTKVATRKASGAWIDWMMHQTAFLYTGAADLCGSVLTSKAEGVYGIVSSENPYGRGLRYGIAEQNMAMMSSSLTQDILPGGFRPVSVFGSYGVFSTIMGNGIRMAVIGNRINPKIAGFFVLLASHDGPDTGEDGPTHQGLYWMSLYKALPGIKVYKPFDANETVEMLFHALYKGEPIVLSLTRPDVPVLKRGDGVPEASEAINGAYVYRDHSGNGKTKRVLVISGPQVLANVLEILPELEKTFDIKIVNVTSPELFRELRKGNPAKADSVFNDEDRKCTITLHNGWESFLDEFLLPGDYERRSIGTDGYLKSGNSEEAYSLAGLAPDDLLEKIRQIK